MAAGASMLLEFIRAEDAGERYAFRLGAQEYVLRGTGGGVENVELQWNQALLADLAALHQPGCEPAVIQRVGRTLRKFLQSEEWARQEAQLIAAVSRGQPVLLTIRSAAEELYALPWELLTLGASGQHLGELPSTLVRYEWPETKTAAESPSPRPEGGRVFLAWSAAGGRVPASEHLRAIQDGARAGHYPFDPEGDVLEHATYGRLDDVLKAATAPGGKPISVLHLLCHGGSAGQTCGLMLDSEHGEEPSVVDAGRLRQLLAPYTGMVRLVVVAACNSGNIGTLGNQLGSVAQALHQIGIAAVIASRFPLSIVGSNRFSETFYRQLLGGPSSVETAFLAARRQLARQTGHLDWASVQLYARDADGHDSRPLVVRPYRGLLAFEPSHSRFFVGRSTLRAELRQRILEAGQGKRPRFQVVAGASGSGKSSLLMAGVAPSLPNEAWTYRVMRPGDMAVLSEAERLRTERSQGKLLLIVDQFEEVFTHLSPEERERQIQRLWALAQQEGSNVIVIATLRVDFLDRCGEVGLGGGLRLDTVVYDEARRLFVPQLEPGEYPEIITEPAHGVGLQLDEGLVERIVADLGEEPGALPLLQYALDLLWQHRSGARLTHEAYERISCAGGIAGALTATMDALYERLSLEEQVQARRVLVSLVDFREDSSPYTRRRVEVAAVRPSAEGPQRTFDAVVERLVQSRFVIRGSVGASLERAGTVTLEVAHEALIRRWERLNQWIHEDREKELQLRQLQGWTSEWTEHQRDPSYLLRGTRLGYALNLRERYANELPDETTRFIEESYQRDERRRWTARLRLLLTVGLTSAAALVMAVLWSSAVQQRQRAQDIAMTTTAQSLINSNPTLAVAVLKEAGKDPDNKRNWTRAAISTLQQPVSTALLKGHKGAISIVAFSPDKVHVLTGSEDGTVRLWNLDGKGKSVLFDGHSSSAIAAAFSPDGNRLITGSRDKTALVWRVDRPDVKPLSLSHSSAVVAVAFGAKADEVITATDDGQVQIWSIPGGGTPFSKRPLGERILGEAVFNSGLTMVIELNGQAGHVWRLDGQGKRLVGVLEARHGSLDWAAFSHDDSRILAASYFGQEAQVWSLDEKGVSLQRTHPLSMDSWLNMAVVSPDTTRVLFTTETGSGLIWNTDGQAKPFNPIGHIVAADFSHDGNKVLTSNGDGAVRLWSAELQSGLDTLMGPCASTKVAFSHDDTRAVVGCKSGAVYIWDLFSQNKYSFQEVDTEALEFSSDRRHVLSCCDKGIRIWRMDEHGRPIQVRKFQSNFPKAFSPNGSRALVGEGYKDAFSISFGAILHVLDLDERSKSITLDNKVGVIEAAFDTDGSRVVVASEDGNAYVWHIDPAGSLELRDTFRLHSREVNRILFSPDGARILVAFSDGAVQNWRADGEGTPINFPHLGSVNEIAYTNDGKYVLTASSSSGEMRSSIQEIRVWRSDGKEEFLLPGGYSSAMFSSDGKYVLGAASNRVLIRAIENLGEQFDLLTPPVSISSATFSPDGSRVVASSTNGAQLWDLGARRSDPITLAAGTEMKAATFSPDGKHVITVAEDGTTQLWTVDDELLSRQLQVSTVCLSTSQRQQYLSETAQEARSRCEGCERRFGRPEESCAFE